jgi:hypothetical protein
VDPIRRRLALAWAGFVLLWFGVVVVAVGPVTFLGCHSENLELEGGSAKKSYCDGVSDFLSSGEPSEWTTPLPYLLLVVMLACLGGNAVWRRSGRSLRRAAIVGSAVLIVHVALVGFLPG